jgi:hypothetical protein
MGLKTTNYYVKDLDYTAPQAYAIIENIVIRGKYARADFVVQANREKASTKKPLERVSVEFTLNRNENPFVTAYNTAKMSYEDNAINEVTGKVEKVVKYNPFFGWNNDIV